MNTQDNNIFEEYSTDIKDNLKLYTLMELVSIFLLVYRELSWSREFIDSNRSMVTISGLILIIGFGTFLFFYLCKLTLFKLRKNIWYILGTKRNEKIVQWIITIMIIIPFFISVMSMLIFKFF